MYLVFKVRYNLDKSEVRELKEKGLSKEKEMNILDSIIYYLLLIIISICILIFTFGIINLLSDI